MSRQASQLTAKQNRVGVEDAGRDYQRLPQGTDPHTPAPIGPGQELFRFVRYWARRGMPGSSGSPAGSGGQHGRDVWVTEAVVAATERGEVTVNDVADELGLDQSGASRMLAHAAQRGYLQITASPVDARRRRITPTATGRAVLDAAHRWQEQLFAELTDDWTDGERADFHRAMARLVNQPRSALRLTDDKREVPAGP